MKRGSLAVLILVFLSLPTVAFSYLPPSFFTKPPLLFFEDPLAIVEVIIEGDSDEETVVREASQRAMNEAYQNYPCLQTVQFRDGDLTFTRKAIVIESPEGKEKLYLLLFHEECKKSR